ncbi:hypothetical protein L228DRAFT_236371 [Xylona heveae TC161]|uniref:Chromosome segregation ATPase family protein n=1 Tax=Xylona heveae (strain CBS 132557 / TC161) TaxID=1328760 RepID=A0A165IQW9_XYLHT|nr:hypothetical protein L228DRAFT_236371 [Xylona heveae TC161]KZF25253.1 hypothetical protein L228DRAFT_236371 [Xylona heveae TC161]
MPAFDREASRDRELMQRHSTSDISRSGIPMWDSSDPERAPPPLPLNPGSPGITTRSNTSSTVAAAAAALSEKARESASPYTTNPMPSHSPERSLIKGPHHRRLQSIPTGNVRDIRNQLDAGLYSRDRSPEKGAPRSRTPTFEKDSDKGFGHKSPEKSPHRPETPTSGYQDTSTPRSSARQAPKGIFGENTPPSATMLALQTMASAPDLDAPLSSLSNLPSPTKMPQTFDALSNQILSLTTIATNLQRELNQLSRRSKDNATDLISLKEATNMRDEDIRRCLRDLVAGLGPHMMRRPDDAAASASRESRGSFLLDSKPHTSPSSTKTSFSLPRIPSPNSFTATIERELANSPSPYAMDGAANLALLEKILREMGTKEGQEQLLSLLTDTLGKMSNDSSEASKKIEEMVDAVRCHLSITSQTPGIEDGKGGPGQPGKSVMGNGDSEPGALTRFSKDLIAGHFPSSARTEENSRAAHSNSGTPEWLGDDVLQLLRRLKDSVTENGGLTAEVKALVRELRGEVLGMGREIGRKLEETQTSQALRISSDEGVNEQNELREIVQDSLEELKHQINRSLQERASALETAQGIPDDERIYDVVKNALSEFPLLQQGQLPTSGTALAKEDVLDAVRDVWENYKPEIELQNFGLERDEILQCLKEGLDEYKPATDENGITKEEVLDAVREGLKEFSPPQIPNTSVTRDEILAAVTDSLERFGFPSQSPPEITRSEILDSVREGMAMHGTGAIKELEINRQDLMEAIRSGLDNSSVPLGKNGEQILEKLHEVFEGMKAEFKQYSAANGRDTEQVLDAVKDGLESLRTEIECYVDRASDVTGKDEIIETMKDGLELLRADVEGYVSNAIRDDSSTSPEMGELMKEEFEQLRQSIAETALRAGRPMDREEMLETVKEGLEGLREGLPKAEGQSNEEILEALRGEFEALRDSFSTALTPGASDSDSSEVLSTLKTGLAELHAKFGELVESTQERDVLDAVKDEFEHIRETLASTLVHGSGAADKDEIIDTVAGAIESLRKDITEAGHTKAEDGILSSIKEEFEHIRATLSTAIVRSGGSDDKDEIISAVTDAINGLSKEVPGDRDASHHEQLLENVREEFEHLRETLSTSMVHGNSAADKNEIIDAITETVDGLRSEITRNENGQQLDVFVNLVKDEFESLREAFGSSLVSTGSSPDSERVISSFREGLESLRGDIEKLNGPEISNNNEVLEAVQSELGSIREEFERASNKPIDMTISYEILDTLKDGLANVKAEFERLQSEKNDDNDEASGREVVVADSLKRNDIEHLEVLITQLRIKVEALDETTQAAASTGPTQPAEGSLLKEDIAGIEDILRNMQNGVLAKADLSELETLLKNVQDEVTLLSEREKTEAKKEDTDAIGTLLSELKGKFDGMALPDPDTSVTKDQVDAVEALVQDTKDAIENFRMHVDSNIANKEEFSTLGALVSEMKSGLDDIKEKVNSENEGENLTKTDLDAVGAICLEIKEKIEQTPSPDPESLPTKSEIEELGGFITELKEKLEADSKQTAQALDESKLDSETLLQNVGEVKGFLEEWKEDLKSKLEDGSQNVESIGKVIEGIDAAISSSNVTDEIKELMETVNREFERAHGGIESLKLDADERDATFLAKHDEKSGQVITELSQKLDQKFEELMARYDDSQVGAEDRAKSADERVFKQEQLMTDSKIATDELKSVVETLGSTITTAADRMGDDSKTVFTRVDNTFEKLQETHADSKMEHEQTRAEVIKVMEAISGVRGDITDHNPKVLDSIKEVLSLVGQHYGHSQKLAEEERNKPPMIQDVPEKYDDSQVQGKLDNLIAYASAANKSIAQMEVLGQVHQQVLATAAEVSAFIASQTRLITEDQENKAQEAKEAAKALERSLSEKQQVDAEITGLAGEKEQLRAEVNELRVEKDGLGAQKLRLHAEVSSLETALAIRREELAAMEVRAEVLERRILEGVIDHSRALLVSRPSKNPANMNLKRVASTKSQGPRESTGPASRKTASQGLGMALKSRAPTQRNGGAPDPAGRRILSLNQITNNVPTGRKALSAMPGPIEKGLNNLKRSHSVRSTYLRKESWGSGRNRLETANKENEILHEGDAEDDGELSDAGTECRRTSYGASSVADSSLAYGSEATPRPISNRSVSYAATESSLADHSDLTSRAGETERSMSFVSDSASHVTYDSEVASRAGTESVLDHENLSTADRRSSSGSTLGAGAVLDEEPANNEVSHEEGGKMVLFGAPSDSGIGSELPTAALSASGTDGDYFG